MNHPIFEELQRFWADGSYGERLLSCGVYAVSATIASNPNTSGKTLFRLLKLHPDAENRSGDEAQIHLYLARNPNASESLLVQLSKSSQQFVSLAARSALGARGWRRLS